jgi:hypothetical protein
MSSAPPPVSRTRVCIYCLRDRPLTDFQGTDHVMPRAFGSFTPINPTLDSVCDECNRHFGDTIEREMARDSLEAVLRLVHKTKPTNEVYELGSKRVRAALDHGDPEWKDCHIAWKDDDGELVASLVPQVGFRRRDGAGWIYVTEKDLNDIDKPLPPEADEPRKGMRLVSSSQEMTERLVVVLGRRGISFEKTRQTEGRLSSADGVAQVSIRGTVDDTSYRCVGKIAFNYLAWRMGAAFVRLETFNAIRAFVRYGTSAPYPLVRADPRPMLADDTIESRQTDGHMVTAAWTMDNKHIVGQVSLFNSLTYFVSLARDFVGVWHPLVTGHHFDHRTGSITMLVNTRPR